MKIFLQTALVILCLVSAACSEKKLPGPVVVHVFRDRAAGEIDSALLALGTKQLRTPDGRPIIVATSEFRSYAEGLTALGVQDHPDLIIFNSPNDGKQLKIDVPLNSAVETPTKRFYLVIPSWVLRQDRQIKEIVEAELRREIQRAGGRVAHR